MLDDFLLVKIALSISGAIFIFYLFYCVKNKEFLAFTLSKRYWIFLSLGLFFGIFLGSVVRSINSMFYGVPMYNKIVYLFNEIVFWPICFSFISFIIIFPFLFVFLLCFLFFYKAYKRKNLPQIKAIKKLKLSFINFLFILFFINVFYFCCWRI